MPHKTKKKFIDKKKAVTFQLVHRSQKDPLAADDEAPQRVLVPLSNAVTEQDISSETPVERENRLSKQRTYGIAYEDDYDYMQHLKEPDKQTAILVPKDNRITLDDDDLEEEMTEVLKDGGESAAIKIPSVVFASKQEEEIGMLHRAIPPVGPQLEWDPDVVAAMDEDFDFDNPENIIDDDFIIKATERDNESQDRDEDESSESYIDSLISEEDEFEREETKSRFTEYSMTSSVLPRNEHLTLLDDQFEKFYETYDDDKIGDLGQVEIDGAVPVHDIGQQEALKMLLGIRDESQSEVRSNTSRQTVENAELSGSDTSSSSENQDGLIELVKEVPQERWDCESILSTYSNIYNHPKIIEDPPKPIKLSKTGIPLDSLPTRGLTAKQLRTLDLENQAMDSGGRAHAIFRIERCNISRVECKEEG